MFNFIKKSIKWRSRKLQREEQTKILRQKDLELFSAWYNMIYPVNKVITINGSDPDEVSKKADTEMAKLYKLRSFDKIDAFFPGCVKRLHSLKDAPVMEINQIVEGDVTKVTATISYAQYALKPGFTEEAFYAAVKASDQATEEYLQYRRESVKLGMDDPIWD